MQPTPQRPTRFADITDEMIQDWKAKHGAQNVCRIDVPGEPEEEGAEAHIAASFVACKPSRSVMDIIGEKGTKNDLVGVNKTLIANCILGGDLDEMERDGSIYTALLDALRQMMNERKASLKKI